MTPRYLLKLATKTTGRSKSSEQARWRNVPPLAQLQAQQYGVNPNYLQNPDQMGLAINQLTEYAMGIGTNGAVNYNAMQHVIPNKNNEPYVDLNSPYATGTGWEGACDVQAAVHKIPDPNKITGPGQNVLSMNKFQNLFNPGNLGNFGRNGGQSLY